VSEGIIQSFGWRVLLFVWRGDCIPGPGQHRLFIIISNVNQSRVQFIFPRAAKARNRIEVKGYTGFVQPAEDCYS
jgi:hypothetical protein